MEVSIRRSGLILRGTIGYWELDKDGKVTMELESARELREGSWCMSIVTSFSFPNKRAEVDVREDGRVYLVLGVRRRAPLHAVVSEHVREKVAVAS